MAAITAVMPDARGAGGVRVAVDGRWYGTVPAEVAARLALMADVPLTDDLPGYASTGPRMPTQPSGPSSPRWAGGVTRDGSWNGS